MILFMLLGSSCWSKELPVLLDNKKDNKLLPVNFYFNSAFDVIQNPYYFSQSDFFEKHKTLFKRIRNPDRSIKRDGGYRKLFNDEVLTSRVVPNLGLHMIGGAYDNLYFYQYFKDNNYPFPLAFTATLSYLGHFGNEALELTNSNITSHDNIADLFVYDVLSFYLAFNPRVMNFLVNDLQMQAWHLQPMYLPKEGDVSNAGLNYIFRPDVFRSNLKPFIFMGMQNLIGISYKIGDKEFITGAVGMALTDPLEQKGKFATGLFYDKNNFLSSSLYINGTEDYRVRLNLYPELFRFNKLKLGLLFGQKRSRDLISGINMNLPIGLAFSH